jgi:PAS domain S-box-containing protein
MADPSAESFQGEIAAESRRFLAALVESSDDAIIGKDAEGILRSWNPAARRLFGYRPEEVIGRPASILVPPELVDDVPALMERLRRGDRIRHYETQRLRKDGSRVEVSLTVSPIRDRGGRLVGASTIARDVTAHKRAAGFDRLLFRAGKVLHVSLDPQLALQRLAELMAFTVADFALTYLADPGGELRRVGLAHADPEGREVLALMERIHPPTRPGHPARVAFDAGEMVLVTEVSDGTLHGYARDPEHLELLRRLAPTSTVVLPLEVRGKRVGALAASTARGGKRPFGGPDLPRLRELARRAALAVDNASLLQAARSSQERLHVALEAARMGTWEWDIEGGRVTWSAALHRIHGLDPGTFEGTLEAFRREIHPADRPRVDARIREVLEGAARSYHVEYRCLRPDGELRWLTANATVVRGEGGRPVRMVGVCADVTHRKKVEETDRLLGRASQVLGASLDPDATLRTLAELAVPRIADWCVVFLAEGGEIRRVALTHPDEPRRERVAEWSQRMRPDPGAPVGVGAAIRTGEPQLMAEVTEELVRAAGYDGDAVRLLEELRIRSAVAIPFRAGNRQAGAILFAQGASGRRFEESDVPMLTAIASRAGTALENARLYQEEREAATALELERVRLERAVQGRDEVLAFVSHDVRNLLGLVETGARTLLELPLPPEKHAEGLHRILRASGKALRLVDNLLENARSEAGVLELELEDVSPREAVQEAAEAFRDVADAAGVRIERAVADDLPHIRADPDQLLRVFANLVTNAIRHSEKDQTVELGASEAGDAVAFHVRDHGPGIPPEDRERLFDRFWQGRRTPRRGAGAGLGLTIARRIVERHGGTIRVESEEGKGSTFTFEIPAAPGGPAPGDHG